MKATSPRPLSLAFQACLVVATARCGDRESADPKPDPVGSGGGAGFASGGTSGSSAGDSGMGGAAGADDETGGSASGASGLSGSGGDATGGNAGMPPVTGGASGASGSGGAAGGGATSTGGTAGAAGSAGGSAGEPPVAGCVAGTRGGTPDVCSFEIGCALSTAIPTVGIIDWSTDPPAGLTDARIEFTLNDPATDELNRGSSGKIAITGTTHRALMLGLKPARTYTYRIVATAGETVCTSPDQTLTTGSLPGAPAVNQTVHDPAARARGFIITSGGEPYSGGSGPQAVYIIDSDGDVVWWTASPRNCSRALMDWEGANMWMMATSNGPGSSGEVDRIGMDGSGALDNVMGVPKAHHDLAVLPGGTLATLAWTGEVSGISNVLERSPDGVTRTVVRLDENVFPTSTVGDSRHANSIMYHEADDTYTVGDVYAASIVKLTRQGAVLWQFGRDCTGASTPKCATGDFFGNHGHHLLDNGNILVFNANQSSGPSTSPVYEFSFTEQGNSLTASLVWSYSVEGLKSAILGDVQRLPNGNTLVIFSTEGQMHEVSSAGELVQTLSAISPFPPSHGAFGYANFRETLYGPPLR